MLRPWESDAREVGVKPVDEGLPYHLIRVSRINPYQLV